MVLTSMTPVAQLWFDDPVLDRPQIARRIIAAALFTGAGLRFDREQIDFAESCRDRSHRGLDAGGQLVLDLLDALVDQLPGEIDVGPILEDDRDLAQAVT
jgi:hypothetical protein